MQAGALRTGEGIRRGGKQYESIHLALAQGAAQELAEKGYGDFSPEGVGARVGVSTRTVFRHYETKLALALAGIETLPTYRGWLDAREPDQTFADRLRAGLRTGSDHVVLVAHIAATALASQATQPELIKALHEKVLAPRRKSIAKFLKEGQHAGVFRQGIRAEALAAADLGVFMMVASGGLQLGRGETRVNRLFAFYWPLIAIDAHLKD